MKTGILVEQRIESIYIQEGPLSELISHMMEQIEPTSTANGFGGFTCYGWANDEQTVFQEGSIFPQEDGTYRTTYITIVLIKP